MHTRFRKTESQAHDAWQNLLSPISTAKTLLNPSGIPVSLDCPRLKPPLPDKQSRLYFMLNYAPGNLTGFNTVAEDEKSMMNLDLCFQPEQFKLQCSCLESNHIERHQNQLWDRISQNPLLGFKRIRSYHEFI